MAERPELSIHAHHTDKDNPKPAELPDSGTDPSDTDERSTALSSDGAQQGTRRQGQDRRRAGKRAQRTERIELTAPLLTSAGLSHSAEKINELANKAPESTKQEPGNTKQVPESTKQAPESTTQVPDSTKQVPESTKQTSENIKQVPESTTQEPEVTNQRNTGPQNTKTKQNMQETKKDSKQEAKKPGDAQETMVQTAAAKENTPNKPQAGKAAEVRKEDVAVGLLDKLAKTPETSEGSKHGDTGAEQRSDEKKIQNVEAKEGENTQKQMGKNPGKEAHINKKQQPNVDKKSEDKPSKNVKFAVGAQQYEATKKNPKMEMSRNEAKGKKKQANKPGEQGASEDAIKMTQKMLHQQVMGELKSLADKVGDDDDFDSDEEQEAAILASLKHAVISVFHMITQMIVAVAATIWHFVPLVLGLVLFGVLCYVLESYVRPLTLYGVPGYEERLEVIARALVVALIPVILGWLLPQSPRVTTLLHQYTADLFLTVLNLVALATFVPVHCLHWCIIYLHVVTAFRLLHWLFHFLGASWLERCFTSSQCTLSVTLTCYTFMSVTGQEFGFMPKPNIRKMVDQGTQTGEESWVYPSLCSVVEKIFYTLPRPTNLYSSPDYVV